MEWRCGDSDSCARKSALFTLAKMRRGAQAVLPSPPIVLSRLFAPGDRSLRAWLPQAQRWHLVATILHGETVDLTDGLLEAIRQARGQRVSLGARAAEGFEANDACRRFRKRSQRGICRFLNLQDYPITFIILVFVIVTLVIVILILILIIATAP